MITSRSISWTTTVGFWSLTYGSITTYRDGEFWDINTRYIQSDRIIG